VSSNSETIPADDPPLRETLKRCSPATYYAACKFRANGHVEDLHIVILGVVERFVERDLRAKLQEAPEHVTALRLRQDLALDSLTMMEIVMIAEEVLQITISNEELTKLATLGEVQRFIAAKVAEPRVDRPADSGAVEAWNVAAVAEHVREIEKRGAPTLNALPEHRVNHA
jgi:acyl carrier protein